MSLAESAYDRLSREFDHQIQEPIPLIFYATHSAFEQNNIILNFIPEGDRRLRQPGAQPHGAADRPARRRALRSSSSHELTHIFQYDILFQGKVGRGVGDRRAAVVHGGHGLLHGQGRGHVGQDVPARRGGQRQRSRRSSSAASRGFLAYRFGHAAFDFIEERWGKEGFRDFLYEFRNTFGGRADRAVERSLPHRARRTSTSTSAAGCARSTCRSWSRPASRRTSDARSATRRARSQQALSPAASPSGDLVAALRDDQGRPRRRALRRPQAAADRQPDQGLHRTSYQYLVAQYLTIGARMGRDLAFSPDGNLRRGLRQAREGAQL